MSLNNPDRDLVNRYLNGELSGIELENFRERMNAEEIFKKEVSLHDLLRSGVLVSKEEELKKKILANIKYRHARIPFSLKLIFTFVVVTTIGITLWFYVGKDSATHNKVTLLFPFLSKEKEVNDARRSIKEKKINKDIQAGPDSIAGGVNSSMNASAEVKERQSPQGQNQSPENDSVSQINIEDKDIVIKKDQLLTSVTLAVNEKPIDKKLRESVQGSTSSQDVAQKLNPAANLPEEEKEVSNIEAEFWVSPVNYRGYKMSNSKLILFGIDEPDAVKLFRSNDALYMKYGNDFFRLVNTFEFLSYQRLKENDVPLAIRQ